MCELLKKKKNTERETQSPPLPPPPPPTSLLRPKHTYLLFGSWFFRDLAVLTGSNDFTISSDTGVSSELPDSSSLNWLGDGVFAAASLLALRRPHAVCGRTQGTAARGNERARCRHGSETAILRCSRRCRRLSSRPMSRNCQAVLITGCHVLTPTSACRKRCHGRKAARHQGSKAT